MYGSPPEQTEPSGRSPKRKEGKDKQKRGRGHERIFFCQRDKDRWVVVICIIQNAAEIMEWEVFLQFQFRLCFQEFVPFFRVELRPAVALILELGLFREQIDPV